MKLKDQQSVAISSLLYIVTYKTKHNVLASLHEFTLYKTNYRWVVPFGIAKSAYVCCFKNFVWVGNSPQ